MIDRSYFIISFINGPGDPMIFSVGGQTLFQFWEDAKSTGDDLIGRLNVDYIICMTPDRSLYATIYKPDPDRTVCHFCIHYADDENYRNNTLSGADTIKNVLKKCSCPVYDISDVTNIIGLEEENILQRGGIIIRGEQ